MLKDNLIKPYGPLFLGISIRVIVMVAVALAVYFLTPMSATLFYELYHLTYIEWLYNIYAALRYLSANFMLWEYRWIASAAVGGFIGIWLFWRFFAGLRYLKIEIRECK